MSIIKTIKKDYKKKAREKHRIIYKKEIKKNNMVVNDTKIYQKVKNKSLLNIEKKKIK